MAKTFGFLQSKGGASKTTTSVNFAWWLANTYPDKRTIMINTDRRGAAETWGGKREGATFPIIGKSLPMKRDEFDLVTAGYDYVVFDGKPLLDELMANTIALSDAIIVPMMPSDEDLRGAIETMQAISMTPGAANRSAAMLLVGHQAKTNLSKVTYSDMSKAGFPYMEDVIERSVAWGESLGSGYSVFEIEPKGRAANDAHKIFQQIVENM